VVNVNSTWSKNKKFNFNQISLVLAHKKSISVIGWYFLRIPKIKPTGTNNKDPIREFKKQKNIEFQKPCTIQEGKKSKNRFPSPHEVIVNNHFPQKMCPLFCVSFHPRCTIYSFAYY